MKGSYGLIVAVVVGVLGVALNWIYLQNKTRDVEKVEFLGLREDVTMQPGQTFKDSDLERVPIAKMHAGNLHEYAHLFSDKPTVVGYSPTRVYQGGQLILRADLRTPPADIAFTNKNQRLITVENLRGFQSSLYTPGDQIDFIVPTMGPRATIIDGGTGQPASRTKDFEVIGPFTIAHIGERLGSPNAARASRMRSANEKSVGVFATWEGEEYDAQTKKLLSLLTRGNEQNIRVSMHSRLESSSGN